MGGGGWGIETEGKETTIAVNMPYLEPEQVFETNLVEENQRQLPGVGHAVTVPIKPFAVATIRLGSKRLPVRKK